MTALDFPATPLAMDQEKRRRARSILWSDGGAGLVAGLVVLSLRGWFTELYGLPRSLVVFIAFANLIYGLYSCTLAMRATQGRFPPRVAINLLIVANLAWALVCIVLLVAHGYLASWLGRAHLALEALFVAVLAYFEARFVRAAL